MLIDAPSAYHAYVVVVGGERNRGWGKDKGCVWGCVGVCVCVCGVLWGGVLWLCAEVC